MQKFKFDKNNLPISIRSRLTPTDLQQLPELFLLEGELLEGDTVGDYCEKCGHLRNCEDDMGCGCKCHGTVEKCCVENHNRLGMICSCPCHNKKEENNYETIDPGSKHFNRETSKEEIYQTYKGVTATVKIDYEKQSCDLQMQNALPEVPEIIGWYDPEQADPILVSKINELVRYLASKENK